MPIARKNGIPHDHASRGPNSTSFSAHRSESEGGCNLTVDLRKQTISGDNGLEFHFDIDPFHKQVLLEGLDDIGMTLKHEPEISAYEKSHPIKTVMYEPVDSKHFAAPN